MHTIVVSVNYRTAPVEIREKLSFIETDVPTAMGVLQKQGNILENIIMSTCNRTEIYVVADEVTSGIEHIKQFLAQWFSVPVSQFEQHLIIHTNDQAIDHLLKVTVGMDSMVLGETQILGQVRDSFLQAQSLGMTGTVFNQLFRQAVTFAKRMHAETEIGGNAVSISYAAVELGRQIFGTLNNKHIAILGAGEMGELALQNLQGSGASQLTVLNRTFATAEEIASRFNGEAKPLEEIEDVLATVDVLISSTASSNYVLTYDTVQSLVSKRKGKPLFLIDIAVPRDLDPQITEIENVFLYDIDDLQGIVDANLAEREQAAEKIMGQVDNQIIAFNEWLVTLGVVPLITSLREKALTIQETTMASIMNKMPDLTEREIKVLMKHTTSIVNQLIKEPIKQVKEYAGEPASADRLEVFQEVFGIEQPVVEEKETLSRLAQQRLRNRTTEKKGVKQSLLFNG